ncbi:alpha/beta fold hydrolase [Actinophytocola sp.]|uniref:alpha/beta fold hydrolase n=1 Tax=Actinophytocola sp. TaxID=1872138 RepID=UPI00389A63F9
MSTTQQVIRFTDAGGRRLAWGSAGTGPPLVLGGWWCGHLEMDWRNPLFRQFLDLLTERFTVIRYDRPGSGLSDRAGPPATSLAEEVAALAAVIDEVGDRVCLFGGSSGSCVAAAYAATHPRRVDRLVLYGGYANGTDIAGAEARESILAAVARHWGVGSRLLADVFLPEATAAERDELVRLQQACMTKENAAASLAAVYTMDVREHLAAITAPTLVVHRREDRAIPFGLGQDVAARVRGATFVAVDGMDHFPWRGDMVAVARAILSFLTGEQPTERRAAPASPALPALPALSTREIEVLRLVAQGMSDQEIARQLVLSVHTVHRHVANVRQKLDVPSRTAAAARAARAGLI